MWFRSFIEEEKKKKKAFAQLCHEIEKLKTPQPDPPTIIPWKR